MYMGLAVSYNPTYTTANYFTINYTKILHVNALCSIYIINIVEVNT